MNQDEISQIARNLISEIVPDLKEQLSLTFTEENGEPVLVATARGSVLHLNPQTCAEKIVAGHVARATFMHERGNAETLVLLRRQPDRNDGTLQTREHPQSVTTSRVHLEPHRLLS